MNRRIELEKKTVNSMISLYCNHHHHIDGAMCDECNALVQYSNQRLDKCVFGLNKPVCSNCPVHCYKPEKREEIKKVMRFAGPRMIYTHPILAIKHIIDKNKCNKYERTN